MSVERLTHEADFGFEDWEETLFFVKSDPNGAYNILDIAKYQGEDEFDEILKNIAIRLSEIENILGDTYDLDRLWELVKADKEGRCEIHKVKDGETVYSIFAYVNGLCPKKTNGKPFKTIATYKVDDFTRNTVDREFGKTVFLNRESAESALAKEDDNE